MKKYFQIALTQRLRRFIKETLSQELSSILGWIPALLRGATERLNLLFLTSAEKMEDGLRRKKMSETAKKMLKYSASEAVKALNPGFFRNADGKLELSDEAAKKLRDAQKKAYEAVKGGFKSDTITYHNHRPERPINERGAIAPHSVSLTTDEQKLNKTEKAYLLYLRNNGNLWVGIQCISLKMGHDCRYVPDFLVLNGSGFLELHEVKGFMRQHSLVKLNVIARTYRFFKVIVVRRKDGAWSFQEVKP